MNTFGHTICDLAGIVLYISHYLHWATELENDHIYSIFNFEVYFPFYLPLINLLVSTTIISFYSLAVAEVLKKFTGIPFTICQFWNVKKVIEFTSLGKRTSTKVTIVECGRAFKQRLYIRNSVSGVTLHSKAVTIQYLWIIFGSFFHFPTLNWFHHK